RAYRYFSSFPTRRSSDLHFRFVRANRELQFHFVRNDVALRAAVNRTDGDHDRIERRTLAADDRLQRGDELRREHDRILRALRSRDRKSTRLNSSHRTISY